MQFISKLIGSRTEEKDFYPEGKDPVSNALKATMMFLSSYTFELADIPSSKSKMLRLPYKGDRIVLDILLPNAKANGEFVSLKAVEKILEKTDILKEFESKKEFIEVDVSLPKFKIESTHSNLKEALKASGMTEMWCGEGADFSGIKPGSGFCVSKVMDDITRGA